MSTWKIINDESVFQKYAFNELGELKSITHRYKSSKGRIISRKGKPSHSLNIQYDVNHIPYNAYGIGFNGRQYLINPDDLKRLWHSGDSMLLTPSIELFISDEAILPHTVPSYISCEGRSFDELLPYPQWGRPKADIIYKADELPDYVLDKFPNYDVYYLPTIQERLVYTGNSVAKTAGLDTFAK